jgi:septum formation protein
VGGLLKLPLILASASPQRRKILKGLKRRFRIIASHVSERSSEKNPRRLVLLLAKRKAVAIARLHPGAAVLGADTMVVCQGQIIGKPRNTAHALSILKLLSGRWQRVYTGVAVAVDGGRRVIGEVAVSRVLARELPEEQLRVFAAKHLDKAGAYAVQDRKDPFVSRVVGDLDNVIGLPLKSVRRILQRAEVQR